MSEKAGTVRAHERPTEETTLADFGRYGPRSEPTLHETEINCITNYDFLEKMSHNMFPPHQPQSQEEYNDMNDRYKAVKARMNDILLDEME